MEGVTEAEKNNAACFSEEPLGKDDRHGEYAAKIRTRVLSFLLMRQVTEENIAFLFYF